MWEVEDELAAAAQAETVKPPGVPGHIASHNSLVVLWVPAVAEVVAVLRFPIDHARSVIYFYYTAYIPIKV